MSEDARVRVEPVCPACDTPVALTSMLATQRVKCVKCGWEGMTRRSMPAVPEPQTEFLSPSMAVCNRLDALEAAHEKLAAYIKARPWDAGVALERTWLNAEVHRLDARIDGVLTVPCVGHDRLDTGGLNPGVPFVAPAFGTVEYAAKDGPPVMPPQPQRFTYDEVLAAVCPYCRDGNVSFRLSDSGAWTHLFDVCIGTPASMSRSAKSIECVANDWRRRHPR